MTPTDQRMNNCDVALFPSANDAWETDFARKVFLFVAVNSQKYFHYKGFVSNGDIKIIAKTRVFVFCGNAHSFKYTYADMKNQAFRQNRQKKARFLRAESKFKRDVAGRLKHK